MGGGLLSRLQLGFRTFSFLISAFSTIRIRYNCFGDWYNQFVAHSYYNKSPQWRSYPMPNMYGPPWIVKKAQKLRLCQGIWLLLHVTDTQKVGKFLHIFFPPQFCSGIVEINIKWIPTLLHLYLNHPIIHFYKPSIKRIHLDISRSKSGSRTKIISLQVCLVNGHNWDIDFFEFHKSQFCHWVCSIYKA